jgi:hypothetical protein
MSKINAFILGSYTKNICSFPWIINPRKEMLIQGKYYNFLFTYAANGKVPVFN